MYDFVPVVCITYTLRHEIHLRLINVVDVFANLLSLLLFAKGIQLAIRSILLM